MSDSLSSDLSKHHDPYEALLKQEKYSKNLIPFDSSSKFARKFQKFKNKLWEARNNMIQGATMGFMVGGMFGFAVGCYSAISTRRFIAIPISTIVSGISFGFILGCGSMIRSAEVETLEKQIESDQFQVEEGGWVQIQHFNRTLSKMHLIEQ